MAVTVSLKQNQNSYSTGYKKWYPRAKYGKIIDITGLARHIHDHHSIYPEDLVRGVLQCATRCTRELMLEGYPVKFDGLGIFKASVENIHGFDRPAYATLALGAKDDNGKPIGIQAIKMICQASGEFTRKELSESSILQWSDLAESIIADDKLKLERESDSQNSTGTNTEQGSSQQGSNNNSQNETVAVPTINGETPFEETTLVTITGPEGAEIRYTTNGTAPTDESDLYSEAITLNDTATVKAIAIKNGISSETATKVFTKNGSNIGSGGFETGN